MQQGPDWEAAKARVEMQFNLFQNSWDDSDFGGIAIAAMGHLISRVVTYMQEKDREYGGEAEPNDRYSEARLSLDAIDQLWTWAGFPDPTEEEIEHKAQALREIDRLELEELRAQKYMEN